MKKLQLSFLFAIFLLLSTKIVFIAAQPPSWQEYNPFFEVSKVDIDCKKSFKYKSILGQYYDGSLLIKCANKMGTSWDFIWLDKTGQQIKNPDSNQQRIRDIKDLEEITTFVNNLDTLIFFSVEKVKGSPKYYLSNFKNGKLQEPDIFQTSWQYEILNPCLFRLPVSDYVALIFSSKGSTKKDYNLYVMERKGDFWSDPEFLNKNINSSYNETHPYVSKDGMLYFTSDRPQISMTKPSKNRASDLWFVQSDFKKYWPQTPVNPFTAPLCSEVSENNLIATKNDFNAGFFVSDRAESTSDVYHYLFNLSTDIASRTRYYALLIGVDDNIHGDFDQLENPISNTRQLAAMLSQKYGFQVDTLMNPTQEDILEKLSNYQHLQSNEYLLLSFFGHGTKIVENGKELCYLVSKDGQKNGDQCISPEKFHNILKFISNPKHILFIIDACYSGLFTPLVMRGGGDFENGSRKIMTSTKFFEVPDDSKFFQFLKEKLEMGSNHPNVLMTGQEIYAFIYEKMSAVKNNKNLPDYFDWINSEKGEFPFPKKKY